MKRLALSLAIVALPFASEVPFTVAPGP